MSYVNSQANAIAAVVASDDPIFDEVAEGLLESVRAVAARHRETGNYDRHLGWERLHGQGKLRNRIDRLVTADDPDAQLIEFGGVVHATGRIIPGLHIMRDGMAAYHR